ncbi:hypothetical protein DPMN_172152 [Dreissena polymorpha]|uniref:Uncharacterized protein n=1 Tax=Dreissena polymorpha TaxID=45954 RepID=A0A9D4IED9_DREPO|nr:hypothetical protein DPMN_172152 [Dreissena polymorpha]
MLSGHADFPFFSCLVALLIYSFVGAQYLIGRSHAAGEISGAESRRSWPVE